MRPVDIICELISISLGKAAVLSEAPDETQWQEVFSIAKKQSLLGVLAPALESLQECQRPPITLYITWIYLAEKIKERNELLKSRAQDLHKMLDQDNVRSCILKGPAFARYYSDPMLRQSGDIDIWVEGGFRRVFDYFSKKYVVKDFCYHHCTPVIFPDVNVEVHFKPSWMNSPILNKRLQRYYVSVAGRQFANFDKDLELCVPTPAFDCIQSFVHTFRHLFQEGVGLRQVMDCYQILDSLDKGEREEVARELRHIGLRRFASAMMHILHKIFDLQPDKYLFEPDRHLGEFMLDDILDMGNFGIYSKDAGKLYNRNLLIRSLSKIKRLSRVGCICFPEFIWALYFKLFQKVWVLVHKSEKKAKAA